MSEALPATNGGARSETVLGDSSQSLAPARRLPFAFHATGGEYFRIWIVNLLLTIVTLGIYSAWAKVRRLRYFYGNTRLDGASFEYHGRPIQILKGRLIAFGGYAIFYVAAQVKPWAAFAFVPIAAFGVPWLLMKSRRFQMHMTSYRGLRFGFTGTYGQALAAYSGWGLLAGLTFGILWPRALWEQVHYLLSKSHYGTEQARFTTERGVFYGFCFVTGGLGGGLLFVSGFVLTCVRMVTASLDPSGEAVASPVTAIAFVPSLIVFVLAGLVVAAYYQKSYLNASFGGLELGPHRVESSLETGPLFAIHLSNFVLIVLTLGLYSPWAKVRQMRYQLENLKVVASGDLDQFVAAAGDGVDAIGEEIGDFFDLDFGL